MNPLALTSIPTGNYIESYNVRTKLHAYSSVEPVGNNEDITDGLTLAITLTDSETDEPIMYKGTDENDN
jgi:hypothetical protein